MTGVNRDYQSSGIGFGLKAFQRHWALMNGFDEMRWTFDPLQRGNANFNMHRLGATSNLYHNNFYGVMQDEINNADLPSDRIEAVWLLNAPDVVQRLSNIFPPLPDAPYLLRDNGAPLPSPLDETQPAYLVQIPTSQSALGSSFPAWRFALRDALTTAFAHGYTTVDFTPANAYLLRKKSDLS
jgi:predicted GNAT superfamily acetyltransferase